MTDKTLKIKSTEIVDTFAEAFKMWGTRVIVTAVSEKWALAAARSMTGFATSVIGCKCEAGIESLLSAEQTPDRRPGAAVLLFAMSKSALGKRLVERVGQCVMTCPTTACFNGLDLDAAGVEAVPVGSRLRYFGDGFQASKKLGARRYWRVPVMDGEFLVEEDFGAREAVGGGNLILLAVNADKALAAATAATRAMRETADVILPFPDGVVRSGSKVGSRYSSLSASTNDAYCPTLKAVAATALSEEIDCALEIVIDGLSEAAVKTAMRAGLFAAAKPGVRQITAGNYGGGLGQYRLQLHDLAHALTPEPAAEAN